MSAIKNRRGRPRRNNNIVALQQNQAPEKNSISSTLNVNIKQPMTILKISNNTKRDNSDIESNHKQQGVELSKLPKVAYTQREEINGDISNEEQRLQEQQLLRQHFGDHNHLPYKRPENHYIHYIEPSDRELYETVEYDMDEQDKAWLQLYNVERAKDLLGEISPILFECIMDKLEKEWFNLIKDAPKPVESELTLPEDSACAVCDDTEVENSNAIVFCDGCNLAVHQDCYGIPYIPEGQWLCRKCIVEPENPVKCIFCPNEGGAFKLTDTNQWGHLLCAIWIPEIGVSSTVFMEPIDMVEKVPKNRWKLNCFICRKKEGACIQCSNKNCCSAFHVTCAKAAKLCMKMTTNPSQPEGVVLEAYCDKHTPKEHERVVISIPTSTRGRGRGRGRGGSNSNITRDHPNSKVARAHQHHYSTGAPIAPDHILNNIEDLPCVLDARIRKRRELVTAVAHYWSLKRESRRGAPLLKRLHLEPWTASSKHNHAGTDTSVRRSIVTKLRADLDKIRMLSEQVQKRERQKLERTKKQKAYVDMITYPLEYVVRPILNQFMDIDRKKVFLNHVTARQAPDYSLVIKQKMCFTEIYQKLSMHKYTTLNQFKHDVSLIWKNSMDYNKVDTPYYKVANKLKVASEKLFAITEEKMSRYQLIDGIWDVPVDESIFDYKLIVEEESEEEEEIEVVVDVKEQQVPKEKAVVEKREPKYRRNKKDYKANPATRNKLRTRTNSTVALKSLPQKQKPTIESTTTAEEAHVQSLTIIQGEKPAAAVDHLRQTSITSYFAEQQRKEQQRKEERERKRLAEEEKKRKEEQEELEKQQAQVSPPAEIICFDIETMQPIVPPTKPLTPPTMIDQPTMSNTIMSNSTIMQPVVQEQQSFVQPPLSELLEDYSMDEIPNMIFDTSMREASQLDEYTTIQEAFKVDPLEPDNNNALFTEIPPIESNNDKNKRPVAKDSSNNDNNSRKRKRSTRLTRSDGLQASIEELTKRPKISQEARSLFASYNGVSHLEKPVEVYKENRKISAPVGWVYVQENEEEKEQQAEAAVVEQEAEEKTTELTEKELKSLKKQRNKIPVPNFKRGEIVWAQVTGYPSHPAKFINLPDDQCSAKILASRRYNGDILVEFLCVPENHKWGWVSRDSICEVGDPEEDKKRLTESLKKKQKKFMEEAKEGYRYAGKILGLDPEPILEAVFNRIVTKRKRKIHKIT